MGSSKVLIASLLLSLLIVHVVGSDTVTGATSGSGITGAKIDCGAECGRRCSETKRPKLCTRACGSCCKECNCVPPGTSGNYESCACYANKTTRGNVRKCP